MNEHGMPEIPVRQDITVLPADDPKKLKLGCIIYESIGELRIGPTARAKLATMDLRFWPPEKEDEEEPVSDALIRNMMADTRR